MSASSARAIPSTSTRSTEAVGVDADVLAVVAGLTGEQGAQVGGTPWAAALAGQRLPGGGRRDGRRRLAGESSTGRRREPGLRPGGVDADQGRRLRRPPVPARLRTPGLRRRHGPRRRLRWVRKQGAPPDEERKERGARPERAVLASRANGDDPLLDLRLARHRGPGLHLPQRAAGDRGRCRGDAAARRVPRGGGLVRHPPALGEVRPRGGQRFHPPRDPRRHLGPRPAHAVPGVRDPRARRRPRRDVHRVAQRPEYNGVKLYTVRRRSGAA